jgi:O-antigen/teichoic acid export membrane protein
VTLRATVLRGGAYLGVREILGIGVRLGGILALTRLLGPADFGFYAGAAALATVLATAAQMGTEIYLVRREDEPSDDLYREAYTLLVVTSAAAVAFGLALSFALGPLLGDARYAGAFRVLLLSVPINILWAPAQAKLERAFRFRAVAWTELGGDLVLYGLGIALALAGLGLWAPVAGYLAWQAFLLVASGVLARARPGWRWAPSRFREITRFGLGFTPTSLLARGPEVVNPLVVGPALGAAAVGQVALALRLGETLGFASRATWRLAVAALAKVQGDARRLRRALEEAMTLQTLALGPVVALGGVLAPWLLPFAFGPEWEPVVRLYPFVAFNALVVGVFMMHGSILYVKQRNGDVFTFNALRIGLLLAIAEAFIPLGIGAFGWALVGSLAALVFADLAVRRLFEFSYAKSAPWLIALAPPIFTPLFDEPVLQAALWLPALAVVVIPASRNEIAAYTRNLRTTLAA